MILSFVYLPGELRRLRRAGVAGSVDGDPRLIASAAVVIGIVMAAGILALTGYFTGTEYRPVKDVGKTSLTGAATVILSGLSVGFESAVYTTLVIGAAVFGAFLLGGASLTVSLFAVALAGCGLLTTVGVIVAMDTFGPVSDNAQGIAEMSGDVEPGGRPDPHRARRGRQHHQGDHQGHRDRHRRARGDRAVRLLRHLGRRGAGQGQPDGRRARTCSTSSSSTRPCWSACCSARPSSSCSPAWRSTPSAAPPARWSTRCAASSARSPGSWRAPVVRSTARSSTSSPRTRCASWSRPGCWRCWRRSRSASASASAALAGFLAGAIGTGTLMAVFLANSGGAWDNAKKLVEDGNHGGKGSPAHEATIIGDTVGDPFKDTAGPAINPLIKVMNLVSLLIAGAVVSTERRRRPERPAADRDRAGGGGDHRRRRLRLQAARGRRCGEHRPVAGRRLARRAHRLATTPTAAATACTDCPVGGSACTAARSALGVTAWTDSRTRTSSARLREALDRGGLHLRRGRRPARPDGARGAVAATRRRPGLRATAGRLARSRR